ncbi:glutamate--tRNA ligase [candidate division CPR3 bacterium 4484_211]|uniref:Glutamate--tRNA ligase n=1 Tax=candidate division CPR3 bacterium 4484_211 TaxID=1968527 RepID=A0A1W9NWZ2_UNCC3|nr:MAG: glutamate--tRNA ligase [candidate division CPR3 bacterium 4484_211]
MPNNSKFATIRVRSAPSPTGRPHIGTAYNALFNYAFARKHGGRFILRIEDTDRTRYVPEAEVEIFEALRWLGLEPDESPENGGEYGPYRQSERLEIYKKYAQELINTGAAYYCFCSKERLEEVRQKCSQEKQPPMYDSHCRKLDPREAKDRAKGGESYVIRLKVPQEGVTRFTDLVRGEIAVENRCIDDQVLLKSDGFPTYHLANVVDDHLMEISHIIRGEEWLPSVPKHILLYNAFGWKPPIYAHTPLLRGKDKSKLGKRHGALPALDYREQGFLPKAVLNYLAQLGWTHPEEKDLFDLSEMIKKFELADINTTAPVFDAEKLTWLNGKWIRSLSTERLAEKVKMWLEYKPTSRHPEEAVATEGSQGDSSPPKADQNDGKTTDLLGLVPLIQKRMKTLADFEPMTDFFFGAPEINSELLTQKGQTKEGIKKMLETAMEIINQIGVGDRDQLESKFRAKAAENSWKMGELCMAVRVAITGKTVSPPLFESLAILEKSEVLKRLRTAVEYL